MSAKVLRRRALMLSRSPNDVERAREVALLALAEAEREGSPDEIARTLDLVGHVFCVNGDTTSQTDALAFQLRGLEIGRVLADLSVEELEERVERAALNAEALGKRDLAVELLGDSLQRQRAAKKELSLATLSGVVHNLVALGRPAEALSLCDEWAGVEAAASPGRPVLLPRYYRARCLWLLGRLLEAEKELIALVEDAERSGHPRTAAEGRALLDDVMRGPARGT